SDLNQATGRVRRRTETGSCSTVRDSAKKMETSGEPVVAAELTPDFEGIKPDDDQRHFKEVIDNWDSQLEDFPLPIQPVGPTLRAIPEGSDEAEEEVDEPYMMHSYDLFVYCGSEAVVYG
ncbi:unnamed protein product, partial [Symbiodinium sp. KB8]